MRHMGLCHRNVSLSHTHLIKDPQLVLKLRAIHIRAQFGATSAHFNVIEFLLFERFFETRAFFASCGPHGFHFPSGLKMCP